MRRRIGLAVFAALAAAAWWAPAFVSRDASGFGDWQWFHHQWESARIAVQRYGEWPLWDPYHCGGVSMWGNPQLQALSPTWALTGLLFGTGLGHKLFVWIHAATGIAGFYVLARRSYGVRPAPAGIGALVFNGSGFFAWHVSGGHSTFLPFYFAPFLLFAWREAAHQIRWCAVVALVMWLMIAEGGHYPIPFCVILLGFDLLLRLPRERTRALGAAALAALLAAPLMAYRFVPILLALSEHPRPGHDTDSLTLGELLQVLTERAHEGWRFGEHRWVWPEYGSYVGYGTLALAVAGALVELRRRRMDATLGALFFGALTMGAFAPWSPWSVLQHLPIYETVHVPSRFRGLLVLWLALLVSLALESLWRRLERVTASRALRGLPQALPWLIGALLVGDLALANEPVINRWTSPPIASDADPEPYHLVRSTRYLEEYANYPQRNVGTSECYDPLPWDISRALWNGVSAQARVEPAATGRVTEWGRTSLTWYAQVELSEPARVVFNQNFATGWVAEGGRLVSDRGRLAVDLPAGTHRVTVRFAPSEIPALVVAFLAGLVLSALVWRVRGRRSRAPTGA